MKTSLNDKQLTLHFEGEINSLTSASIEADVNETLKDKDFSSLVLDFEKVNYVSSAGLRIILKLKQKYSDVKIINVSLEVYDVLQMTGFTNIMEVSKALRFVDLKGATPIGAGFTARVYRINKDTIVKVFKDGYNIEGIEHELNLAKQAFILGIPTAISYDIVKVNDNRLGVVFEMLDCESLRDAFVNSPNRYDELIDKYVKLLLKINSTEPMDANLPDAKQQWREKVEAIKDYFEPAQYKKLKELIETIPEKNTFVHGDCHFKNIMIQGDDLYLIDMDTLSKGHHIFELAALYCPYIAFEEDDPGNNEKFLGVSAELSRKVCNDIIEKYFNKKDEDIVNKIRIACYTHMVWWYVKNASKDDPRINSCKARLLTLVDKYNDLVI